MWRNVWEILIINFVSEKSQGIRYFPTAVSPLDGLNVLVEANFLLCVEEKISISKSLYIYI